MAQYMTREDINRILGMTGSQMTEMEAARLQNPNVSYMQSEQAKARQLMNDKIRSMTGSQISDRERALLSAQAQPPRNINGLLGSLAGSSISDREAQMLRDGLPSGMYNQAPVDNFRISPYGNVSDAEIQRASEMFKLGQMTDKENQMFQEMLPEQFARSQDMKRNYDVSQGGLSGSYVDKLQEKSKMMQLLKNTINKFRGS